MHTLERVSCEETALLRRTAGCSCETCPESVPACCCRVCRQETHVAVSSQDQRATSSAFGSSPRVVCQSTLYRTTSVSSTYNSLGFVSELIHRLRSCALQLVSEPLANPTKF